MKVCQSVCLPPVSALCRTACPGMQNAACFSLQLSDVAPLCIIFSQRPCRPDALAAKWHLRARILVHFHSREKKVSFFYRNQREIQSESRIIMWNNRADTNRRKAWTQFSLRHHFMVVLFICQALDPYKGDSAAVGCEVVWPSSPPGFPRVWRACSLHVWVFPLEPLSGGCNHIVTGHVRWLFTESVHFPPFCVEREREETTQSCGHMVKLLKTGPMTNALEGQIKVAASETSQCLILKVYLDVVAVACGIVATVVFCTVCSHSLWDAFPVLEWKNIYSFKVNLWDAGDAYSIQCVCLLVRFE